MLDTKHNTILTYGEWKTGEENLGYHITPLQPHPPVPT
jgi:hypothetical protein